MSNEKITEAANAAARRAVVHALASVYTAEQLTEALNIRRHDDSGQVQKIDPFDTPHTEATGTVGKTKCGD